MEVSIKDRWLSALCYLSLFVCIPIFTKDKSQFLAKHCRQGFVLLFAEIVLWLLLIGIGESIGRIPVLGFLISILLHLVYFLVFLILSVLGFMKGLSGETWRLPVLDDFAEKVPIN